MTSKTVFTTAVIVPFSSEPTLQNTKDAETPAGGNLRNVLADTKNRVLVSSARKTARTALEQLAVLQVRRATSGPAAINSLAFEGIIHEYHQLPTLV